MMVGGAEAPARPGYCSSDCKDKAKRMSEEQTLAWRFPWLTSGEAMDVAVALLKDYIPRATKGERP